MSTENSDDVMDMDALLAGVDTPAETQAKGRRAPKKAAEPAVVSSTEEADPAETPAQRRIRELQAELDKPSPVYDEPEEFVPASKLSPEERQVRDLEDRLTAKRLKEAEAAPTQYDNSQGEDTILIHFLADGFTAMGQIWYRGQEVEFVVGSQAHTDQIGRDGKSWLDLASDPAAQYARWGEQKFALGPWPGAKWGDVSVLTDPEDIENARKAAAAEQKRSRRAPVLRHL